jgi:hypothetical protein
MISSAPDVKSGRNRPNQEPSFISGLADIGCWLNNYFQLIYKSENLKVKLNNPVDNGVTSKCNYK